MRRKILLNAILAGSAVAFMAVAGISTAIQMNKSFEKAEATEKPKNINLNDTSEAEIRNYYSYLNNLPDSERRGQNLLKNLKYILVNNPSNPSKPAQYFTYSQVREIYRITDRNWYSSPATGISGYDPSTNTISNFDYSEDPYLYYYYRDDNFTNPHTATAKVTSKEGKTETLLNQEHIWSKSHGFSSRSGVPNAGSDLHHLVAADVAVNKWAHSNASYGYVDTEDSWASTKVNWDNGANAILGNKRGSPANPSSEDEESVVFEPRDADKGDFARALLFMVARYNYIGDSTSTHSIEEPNLELVDHVIAEGTTINCSTTTDVAQYGKLSDLLQWHMADPVVTGSNQDFEVHRNNLIYENYQYTRNPFIDFPEWVDYIWGDKKETGVASPASDNINGYGSATAPTSITLNTNTASIGLGNTFTASVVSVSPSDAYRGVNWSSSNSSVAKVTNAGVITGLSAGTATITAASMLDSSVTASINVTVSDIAVTSISLNKTSLDLQCGGRETLNVSFLPENASVPTITWTSSDTDIASVENGRVNGKSEGTCTITASDGNGHTDTCTVEVSGVAVEYSDSTYEMITSVDQFDINRKMAFVAKSANYAMSTNQKTNNRDQTEVVKDNNANTITMTETVAAFTVETGTVSGTYSFKDANGYIYAAGTSSTQNYLKSKSTKDNSGSFSLSFNAATGVANIMANGSGNNYLRYNSNSKLFACYATSGQQGDVCLYQQMAIPLSGDIPVTGVGLTKTTMRVGTSMSKQLVAVISPAEATNKDVTWSSSDPYVARVNGEGVITGVSAGVATISVTTDDGDFTASCVVTVIDSGIGSKYYEKITSLSDLTTGKYVVLAEYNDEQYAIPNELSTSAELVNSSNVFAANNKISAENADGCVFNVTVSTSGDGTQVDLKDANDNYLIWASTTSLKGYSTSSNHWIATESERGYGTFRLQNTDSEASSRYLVLNNSNLKFGAYTFNTSTYIDLEFYKYVEISYTEADFISDFMSAFTCDATGHNEPQFIGDWTWANLKAKYKSLTDAEQLSLKEAEANEGGTNEEKCVARYDAVIRSHGATKYENFMGRTIVSHSNSILIAKNNGIIFLVVAVSVLSIVSVGVFLHIRKKRRQ